ncbi:MAG TPA: glutamate-1-semialdehyde 2,1-aminomutase [Longimicrobiales bacterium]|nr:glutamate-1-semialdehyde 2,1-aminomutase [Longimicrobiales bacterium]
METRRSQDLFDAARKIIPGGVNSPVRAFRSVGGEPLFIARAEGATVWDADGNAYLDFVGSWGPMLLGHNHPAIRTAVARALDHGTSFGAPTAGEVELAGRVVEMVPSVEMVRLVSSGTEATMSALRLARAFTGRDGVIKFRGGYHGHGDAFLVEAGSGAATLGVPNSPGVTAGAARDTGVAEFNDLESVARLLDAGDVAAVFVEPIAGNMGCVAPEPGFLEGLRELCDGVGTLLVFDEVMTGFRVAPGGAQERYGVLPDLTTLGKVIGGGLPVGAFGGRADIMSRVAPSGPVYQAGTLSGNPLATAAGNAMLGELQTRPEIYEHLEALGRILDEGFAPLTRDADPPLHWSRVGAMGALAFTPRPVRDWQTASAVDTARFARFFRGMLDEGIYLAPSAYEALFLSAAHTEADMERLVETAGRVLRRVEVSA